MIIIKSLLENRQITFLLHLSLIESIPSKCTAVYLLEIVKLHCFAFITELNAFLNKCTAAYRYLMEDNGDEYSLKKKKIQGDCRAL